MVAAARSARSPSGCRRRNDQPASMIRYQLGQIRRRHDQTGDHAPSGRGSQARGGRGLRKREDGADASPARIG
jgi:hypothetical protein